MTSLKKLAPQGYLWVKLLPRYQDRSKDAVTPLLLTANASQVFGATDVDGEEQRGDFLGELICGYQK